MQFRGMVLKPGCMGFQCFFRGLSGRGLEGDFRE